MALIQKLYRVEKQARDLDPEARQAYRYARSGPILDKLHECCATKLLTMPPQRATGKGLACLIDHWDRLFRYLDDGRLEIENNLTENAIRPFVVGRKNWLFSDSVKGVTTSANLYSLIETAKANGLEPYAYLRTVFAEPPAVSTVANIEALPPHNFAEISTRHQRKQGRRLLSAYSSTGP